MHNRFFAGLVTALLLAGCNPKVGDGLRRNDLRRDVEMRTTKGTMVIRLYDETPLHRDNFLRLVKRHYYDGLLFHRVIKNFMIQGGDPESRRAGDTTKLGNGGPAYTVPAEFRADLFHFKGVVAAAREGDDVNPARASSASQFYIVQGKTFSAAGLDSVERYRLKGITIPPEHRAVYRSLGGTPHLDGTYTVFGRVIRGLDVIDSIASVATRGRSGGDRPLADVRITRARLIRRRP